MTTYRTSHRTDYDDTAAIAEDYANLNLAKFPVNGDTNHGNDVILAAFREGVEPATSFNRVAVVGTGGEGLYERDWAPLLARHMNEHNLKHNDPEILDLQYAMRFARDIAAPYDAAVRDLNQGFFSHTDTARRMRADMERSVADFITRRDADPNFEPTNPALLEEVRLSIEAGLRDRPLGQDSRESLDTVATRYVENHPDDWQNRYAFYTDVCQKVVEAGANDVMLGLMNNDEDQIAQGRAVMAHGAQMSYRINEDNDFTTMAELSAYALRETAPRAKATAYQELFNQVKGTMYGDTETDYAQDRFIANALLSQEFSARYHENMGVTGDARGAGSNVASFNVRMMSDHAYRNRLDGPLNEAVESLANGDMAALGHALEQAKKLDETFHALVYRYHEKDPELPAGDTSADFAMTAMERLDEKLNQIAAEGTDHPQPHLEQLALLTAREQYLSHARTMVALEQGDTSRGTTDYSLRLAQTVEYMIQPDVIEDALDHLAQNPNWRQELAAKAEANRY